MSCIIDNVTTHNNFLDYIENAGYKILLKNDAGWIRAELIGTGEVLDDYISGTWRTNFGGYGKTKEQALKNLKNSCSGRTHYPHFSQGFFVTKRGPASYFPIFNT